MTPASRLARLRELAALQHERELAVLAAARARTLDQQERLRQIELALRAAQEFAERTGEVTDVAQAGAYRAAMQARIRGAEAAVAQAEAEERASLDDAARAFGRTLAIARISAAPKRNPGESA